MAKALGIGGVFFKSRDPAALAQWYKQHLDFPLGEGFNGAVFPAANLPDNAYAVWGLFEENTEYFKPSSRDFMLNIMVDDVAGALQQVIAGGARQVGEIETMEYGVFGWFEDPEGNKVELWTPA